VPRNSAGAAIIPDATFRTGASISGPLVSRGSSSAGSRNRQQHGHIVDGPAAEVQKQYTAGLEMGRPGGDCLKLGL
jgi:hypothetical protein